MNYYSHNIGDYLIDTAHLSILEDGCYRRLMDRYYATEKTLPSNEISLFRLIRAHSEEERNAIVIVLNEFFILTEAGWTHKRCDKEINAYQDKSIKASEAANKRWHNPNNAVANPPDNADAMPTQCDLDADAMPTQCERNANQEPRTNNQEPITKRSRAEAKKTATASRLPPDWHPSDSNIAFCQAERPDLEPTAVAARFRDFWIAKAGREGLKLDWSATWRNWVRNERLGLGMATANPQKSGVPWWSSNASILQKAEELNLTARNGERTEELKARIQACIDNGGKPVAPKIPKINVAINTLEDAVRRVKPANIPELGSLVKFRAAL